jgi:hypothetical protein
LHDAETIEVTDEGRQARARPRIPLWRWALWYSTLGLALAVFYGLFTPVWFFLRSVAWLAEYRARRRG